MISSYLEFKGYSAVPDSTVCRTEIDLSDTNPGGGVPPYVGYIGMCGPKGYGFSAVLVINRVSILAILAPFWS